MGDVVSWGLTAKIRETDWYGGDNYTDQCSNSYEAGEWGGFVASSLTGLGGGMRLALARMGRYGARKLGLEFSHWIPRRYFRSLGLQRLDKVSIWNGNFVTKFQHTMHDKLRHGVKGVTVQDKWYPFFRQVDRVPLPFKGFTLGAGYGVMGMHLNK